jgi:hypothetical protein
MSAVAKRDVSAVAKRDVSAVALASARSLFFEFDLMGENLAAAKRAKAGTSTEAGQPFQSNTTVLLPFTNTQSSTTRLRALASTIFSTSRPAEAMPFAV